MEIVQRRRTPLRRSFTKTANLLDEELKSMNPDVDKLASLLEQVEDKGSKLAELDRSILELLQGGDCTQEEYDTEFDNIDTYNDRLIDCRSRAQRLLARIDGDQDDGKSQASVSDFSTSLRKFKLPDIELKKFGGDLRDWLGFWGQFKKIDSDPQIALEDKYQYLLQATIIKSRAREIVESFPPTAENYSKAVEHLKSRFGREETLVEVYVRDLLRLVLINTTNSKQKITLSTLYDRLETQLRALETLGVASDKYAAMLYPLVESCLPEEILRTWERSKGFRINVSTQNSELQGAPNSLNLLMNFLRNEVDGEERVKMARAGFGCEFENWRKPFKKFIEGNDNEIPTAAGLLTCNRGPVNDKKPQTCIFCGKRHASHDCWQAKKMTFEEKRQLIIRNGCCFLCLKKGHMSRTCTGKQKCTICQKRHFALMCPDMSTAPAPESINQIECNDQKTSKDCTLSNQTCSSSVQLQTMRVYLRGEGKRHIVRALIDTGSQKSYISSRIAKLMGYEVMGEEKVVHSLFGGVESSQKKHCRFRIYLTSLDEKYNCNFEVLDQENICGNIIGVQDGPWMKELTERGISLTDTVSQNRFSSRETNMEIQVLIGADVAGRLLTGELHTLSCGLVAIETHLGWTVMGKVPKIYNNSESSSSVVSLFSKDTTIADFWRLDSIGITDPAESQTKVELQRAAHQQFRNTLTVDDQGRYEVSLPWLEMHPPIPSGFRLANRRLNSTIKRLKTEDRLESYQEVLNSWLKEEMIEKIPSIEEPKPGHYLPHRAVIKESATTKIRPVFDASAHEKGSPSLNSCLEKGPNLLELIPSVLTRFRMKKIGVVSDIRQAFLQISVNKNDRDFLRFLWQENGNSEHLRIYRHCRVVFGLSSSPFLLGATIAYHLENVPAELKETAKLLQDSFYVDNCVTSLDDADQLEKFITESKEIMFSGKFDLRGWRYNLYREPYTFTEITSPSRNKEECDLDLQAEGNSVIVPVLGMYWNLREDTIFFDISRVNGLEGSPMTKRKMLSLAQKIFDPLGLICPVTLLPKLQLQECWKLNVSWDQELPESMTRKFATWQKELKELDNVKIPRWMIGTSCLSDDLTLHVFCDASKHAYATCIFICVKFEERVSCQLVRAKVRVAPLKSVTIPRLELLACCIGARLADTVKKDMRCPVIRTFYWSDSANALYWIKKEDQWATFVANRVKEIRSLSNPDDWYYVPGNINPADIPSRGCSGRQLLHWKWWEGPDWVKLSPENWPKSDIVPNEEFVNSERKKTVISATSSMKETQWYCRRFSSFLKIIRMIAWIYRFLRNSRRTGSERYVGDLTLDELQAAEVALLKLIQKEAFDGINDPVLSSLQPVMDEKGIVRIKTRISARKDTEEFRFPIVLPAKHPVVSLLIQEKHRELSHAGIQILMVNLRENYWILKCRKTIRQAIKNCGSCRRFKVANLEVVPAPLPENRVREAAVFEITGIDLAGPLYLKGGQKTWFVIFTCAVFRAIHLELVTSLSTEAFLQALRRFIARRGRPNIVYSDNGTNFVGADNAFKGINWKKVTEEAVVRRIQWNFIPPTAAWWGGWWERLIRMVKEILRSVLGKASLTYEELLTVLCDAEGVINSRPLTYVSDDVEDLIPLTPAMFLQEISAVGVPDLDTLDSSNANKRYRYRQKLRENIRKRFRIEYLGQLKHMVKVKRYSEPVFVGQIVLIGSDNSRRIDWPLARILELYPGKDGHVRVARVKTQKGDLLRPVQRLFPLELDDEQKTSLSETSVLTRAMLKKVNQEGRRNRQVQPTVVSTRSGRQVKPPKRLIDDVL